MKVNDSQRIGSLNPYKRAQAANAASGTGKKGKKDEVQISSEAKELLGAQQNGERQKRIEDLKQSVSAGTYSVDAKKLAEKMLPYLNDK